MAVSHCANCIGFVSLLPHKHDIYMSSLNSFYMIDNYLLKNSSRHNVYVDAREEDPPKRPLGSGTNGPEPKGDDKTN